MPIQHLPKRLQPGAYRLRAFLMTDAVLMMALGLMALARGFAFLSAPVYIHPAEMWLPLSVWAAVWMTAGFICIVAVVSHTSRVARVSVGVLVALHVMWGGSYAVASFVDHVNLWVSAINMWGIASIALWAIWRGSRTEIRFSGGDCG